MKWINHWKENRNKQKKSNELTKLEMKRQKQMELAKKTNSRCSVCNRITGIDRITIYNKNGTLICKDCLNGEGIK